MYDSIRKKAPDARALVLLDVAAEDVRKAMRDILAAEDPAYRRDRVGRNDRQRTISGEAPSRHRSCQERSPDCTRFPAGPGNGLPLRLPSVRRGNACADRGTCCLRASGKSPACVSMPSPKASLVLAKSFHDASLRLNERAVEVEKDGAHRHSFNPPRLRAHVSLGPR